MDLAVDEQLLVAAEESIPQTLEYFHLLEHPFLSGPDFRFHTAMEKLQLLCVCTHY